MSSKTKARLKSPARRLGCVAALATAILLIALGASASADISFCVPGSGAGQCKGPGGVAVDPSNGHLYVADSGNNRVNVFDSTGSFLFSFGWGVADGTSAQLQSCTATCFAGLQGGGAGEFTRPSKITVDPAAPHDVYTFEQYRVQKFSSSGEFLAAWGGGVISGGASGKGDLSSGSTTVSNVITTKKNFAPGQAISGTGIPAGARIAAVGPGTITLSKAATAAGTGVALTAPEGAGNIAVNEVQVLDSLGKVDRGISFSTPNPSPSTDNVKTPLPIPNNAPAFGPGSVQSLLEGLSNIDPGDVSVSGPNGGPYTIEFKGRYADTDVDSLKDLASGGEPALGAAITTTQNGGGSKEICTVASDCAAGVEGTGDGQFNNESEPIAVGAGGVYVGDSIRSPGDIFDSRIEKFDPSGAFVEGIALPGTQSVEALAVDSGGDIYARRRVVGVEKLDPSGTPLFTLNLDNALAIAVDSSDNLFAYHRDGTSRVITEFDPSGSILRRFGYGAIGENLGGIAVYAGAQGDVFGSEPFNAQIRYLSFPPRGPLACCLETTLGNTKATLKGAVNPEGKATTYHFDYVTEAAFKVTGFNGAASSPESAPIGSDFALHDIEAQIGCASPQVPPQPSCLKPSTDYRYRLVAKNEDGENSSEGTFKTKPPFEILATYATDVGTDATVLHTTVNPFGIPATGYLEYVGNAAYQADIAEGHDGFTSATKVPDVDGGSPPFDFGAGEAPKTFSAVLSTLTPGTTYHYRAVITDSFASEIGPERSLNVFTAPKPPANSCPNPAFRTGASANLPDCRAYEMVSPVDKNGGDIKVLVSAQGYPARLEASSNDGSSFAFSSVTAFAGAQSSTWTSEYMATRKAGDSWSTQAISPPRSSYSNGPGITAKLDSQFKIFSGDLASGWLIHDTDPPLDPCAPEGFRNLYRRDSSTGNYEALIPGKPLNSSSEYLPELQGVSADGTHAVFRANAKLTANANNALSAGSGKPVYQLYEHVKGEGCGELRLVSVLPNGKAFVGQSSAGTTNQGIEGEARTESVARAVSADGSRIFWTALTETGEGAIYLRIDGTETVQVTPAINAHFWTAATDGSKAIYTIGQELYEAAVPGNTPASTLIAKGVKGVVGASEDASRVYFVSTEALGGEGEAGEPNLYLYEAGGATSYVATLYGGDATLPTGDLNGAFQELGFALAQPQPIRNGVRVSADGSHLAFVSTGRLTGYDNADAVDGLPDLEVYLYDTATDNLACISCNPSGARPAGRLFGQITGIRRRVSGTLAPGQNQSFFPRSLSADGNRLFFESFEALLPRDTNGKQDVYQWQRAGSQTECEAQGAELYVPSAGGCLSLISTGQSPIDSEFADASPDGSDVFIRTASSLLIQDPGQVDVYDARIGGGLPAPRVLPPSCEGEACQGPLAPPSDPTPASSAFEGAGNVSEAVAAKCAKGKVSRKGRCVAQKGRKPSKQHASKQAKQQTKNAKQTKHNRGAGR